MRRKWMRRSDIRMKENINFIENNFTPYLSEPRLTMETYPIIDGNEDEIITNNVRQNSVNFQYSIDAIPFVINPSSNPPNEIIRLDRYYDKNIEPEKHELASEGKINYYLYPRKSGRTEKENIDTYAFKDTMTGGGGKSRFDFYASARFA